MRKYIILTILLSCLHIAARGQTIASLDDIDLSGLPTATKAKALRYWFDDNTGNVKITPQLSGTLTLEVDPLIDGLHTIHFQVIDDTNAATSISSALFMKMGGGGSETVTAKKLMYWFDDETAITTVDVSGGVQMLDASRLMDGLHTLHFQVLCSNGMLTSATSALFMRMNIDAQATTAQQLRYWFDDAQTATTASITAGATTLDAKQLTEGLHTVHYQIVDSRGAVCPPSSALFMKMDAATQATQAQRLRYWFDDDATTLKVIDVAKGTQTLDVSTLLTGLHTLCYQLVDSEGKVSTPYTRLFMKAFDKVVTDGQNRVTKYQYWLNSNSQAMQTVTLNAAANPYTLISLLSMPKEPIHSDCFHFEVTNGKPTVYAKNIFHIRFHDAAGYFADGDRPFIDYSVKQEVTGAELLNNGDHKDTARPVGNDIKWYRLTAEPGDSVQFRLDRAATIQLFAPSGEEVLSASASDVVKWFGCHVRESGTYYVALHNVTATSGTTVGIDYEHIDKYAVLRQDVTLVGNGGCSTITFEGNGFRDLYAVDLFTEQGDSIHHVYIGHESDATTSVVFDFTGAALGTYHAKFRFTEEDKVFNNIVTVEEARDIELATTVTYPSTFLRGSSTTFTIKIENKGNMTAYQVPVEIQLFTENAEAITYAKFSENIPSPEVEWLDGYSFSQDSIKSLNNFIVQNGDLLHFFNMKDSIETRNIKESLIAIDVAPNSFYTISLTLKSSEMVELQTIVPAEWITVAFHEDNTIERNAIRRISKESMCCIREKVECVMNVAVGVLDFVSIVGGPQVKIADCIASLGNTTLQYAYDVWCGEQMNGKNPRKAARDLAWDAVNGIVGCICSFTNIDKFNLQWIYQHIYNNISTTMDCVSALTTKVPNCPPNPGGGGGSSNPVQPSDPNDIFGYTAESGSHAIKDGQTDVYYRIEFENDTAFDTASAHDIYVTDTLDATKFDLSTFKPTRVRIGEKSAELTGDKNFVTTIDMRPGINAIAQVEGTYDEKKGIAKWHISSLDPMTMEPTKYVMDGVLPVNYDGRGIGEVMYDISLKPGLAHGTEIRNRAGIVFDTNDVIMTPTWTNTIDRVKPVSRITKVEQVDGGPTASVSIEASDEGSGPWRYNVYVQYGSGAWFLAAENVPADTTATVKVYEDMAHHFYCVATDMAGNVEEKEPAAETSLVVGTVVVRGDMNGDGRVTAADIWALMGIIARGGTAADYPRADLNGDGRIDVADVNSVVMLMAH